MNKRKPVHYSVKLRKEIKSLDKAFKRAKQSVARYKHSVKTLRKVILALETTLEHGSKHDN